MVKRYYEWKAALSLDMYLDYCEIYNQSRVEERLALIHETQISFSEFVAISFDYDAITANPIWWKLFIEKPSTLEEAVQIYKEYKTKETPKIELKW